MAKTNSGANCSHIAKSSYDKMWASIIRKMNAAAGGTKMFPKTAALMGDTEHVVLDVYNHIVKEKEDVSSTPESALAL